MPTGSNPNLRQSFNEYVSPEASGVGTPESGSMGSQGVLPHFSQPLGVSSTLPDLNAMMFPSEDPFAYPNQPMMELDNFKQENLDMMSASPVPQMYIQNNTAGGQLMYDDLEGQVFGPFQPYMAQGQPEYDMRHQMAAAMNAPQMTFPSGLPSNFDGLYTNGEVDDFANMIPSQRFRS
jgi:hypothetical protein